MDQIYTELIKKHICEPFRFPSYHRGLFLTTDPRQKGHWLVGDHPTLTRLAKQLRTSRTLCETLHKKGVRFGFRRTDLPPRGQEKQVAYGLLIPRKATHHVKDRRELVLPPVSSTFPAPGNRLSDRFQNVALYWKTQTPQAHHIVEFNNLAAIGVSSRHGARPLDYDRLPCVLLMAEFHQRYISSHLKPTHATKTGPQSLLVNLFIIYRRIYLSPGFHLAPLWEISQVILTAADREFHTRSSSTKH